MADYTPPDIKLNLKLPSLGWIAAIFIGILLIVGLWMSYYTVGPESQGVVRRFGKYLQTVDPGLHFKVPFGMLCYQSDPGRPGTGRGKIHGHR